MSALNVPFGFRLVPVELTDEQAETIAISLVQNKIKLINLTREHYIPSQFQDMVSSEMVNVKKQYRDTLALLSFLPIDL